MTMLTSASRGFSHKHLFRRSMSVYSMGMGWSGATGVVGPDITGHDDEEEPDEPALILDVPIKSAAAGWGHSAFVSEEGDLFMCGRPHDFNTLLRLKRLPGFIRKYAIKSPENDRNFVSKALSYMVGAEDNERWEKAQQNSFIKTVTKVDLPDGEKVKSVEASAGLTAIVTEKGKLFAFGLNHHGQCGIGDRSNNVWEPAEVKGLSADFAFEGRALLDQDHPIERVALGLQHGVAMNQDGSVFTWGKGDRGQLGLRDDEKINSLPYGKRIQEVRLMPSEDGAQRFSTDFRVKAVAAGMNHSAALGVDNGVYIWGKNVAPPAPGSGDLVSDAYFPIQVKGLPSEKEVVDISCGSHHTAMLLEDGSVYAVGVGTDNNRPILEPYELIPSGAVEFPVKQFEAHFDRTTLVGNDGSEVLQAHMWSNSELRDYAVFTPTWMDHFSSKIKSVHRGWLHTIVITDE